MASSTIDTLPTEILTEVFNTLNQSIDRCKSDASSHSLLNALLVCRHWHTIIISTPALWTTVWIGKWGGRRYSPEGEERDYKNSPSVQTIRHTLERSGPTRPLDIIVHADAASFETSWLLDACLSRWNSITFLPDDVGVSQMVDVEYFFERTLPNLRLVDIQLAAPGLDEDIYISAPQLQMLKCMDHRVHFEGVAPHLVFIQASGVTYSYGQYPVGIGGSLPFESLQACTETVEYLSLDADWDEDYGPNFTFPRLHTLRLSRWTLEASEFLRRASLPALRTLHVGWRIDDADFPIAITPQHIEAYPTFLHLKELQWEGTSTEKIISLRILLASTPNLQILSDQETLGPNGEGGALITALASAAQLGLQNLCPMLRELHIQRASSEELDHLTSDSGRFTLEVITVRTLVDEGVRGVGEMLQGVRDRGVRLLIGDE